MIKIAMTGEGPTDYGIKEYGEVSWGPAYWYARKLLETCEANIEFVFLDKHDVRNMRLQGRRKLTGMGAPAYKFYLLAKDRGCSAGIFYSDVDRETGKKNTPEEAEKRFRNRYNEICEGLKCAGDSEAYIPMLPLRMIENWQLADKNAIETAYEITLQDKDVPAKPEFVWGDENDPNSNHPKTLLRRIINSRVKRGNEVCRDKMVEVAQNSRPEVLKSKCSISYGCFSVDIERIKRLF